MSVAVEHVVFPAEKFVINHDTSVFFGEDQAAMHLASGRALGISAPGDILQLHPALKDNWEAISAHYERIGLRHSRNVVWSLNPKELGSHAGYHPSVFYFSPHACQFWGDYEWLAIVEWINSRNNLVLLANELGIETPDTQCFRSIFDISDNLIESLAYPCYLKSSLPQSGTDTVRCRNPLELRDALLLLKPSVPVQIQQEVMADCILTLQFILTGSQVIRKAAIEHPVGESADPGYRAPASYEPWESVEPIARWLNERGMKGSCVFELAVTRTPRGIRFPVLGCYPHYDDTSYPIFIAEKLGIPEWRLMNFKTRHRQLANLDLSEVEFDARTGEGAILVNWGLVSEGELGIMLAGSIDYQAALEEELRARL